MAGYSGTPLYKKLGIKAWCKIHIKNPPANYFELVSPLPENVEVAKTLRGELDIAHLFTSNKSELVAYTPLMLSKIKSSGMIWISWPKKKSKVATDITENTIRATALPLGLVDVKVCAVDDVWSGQKLVIRKENRK